MNDDAIIHKFDIEVKLLDGSWQKTAWGREDLPTTEAVAKDVVQSYTKGTPLVRIGVRVVEGCRVLWCWESGQVIENTSNDGG